MPTALPAMAKMRPEGEWNDYHIIAKGNEMTLSINGVVCSSLVDNEEGKFELTGLLGLQLRSGDPMKVQFKDILYRELYSECCDDYSSAIYPWYKPM